MRPSCFDCVRKHLGQALVYVQDYHKYRSLNQDKDVDFHYIPDRVDYCIEHLSQALVLAEEVRKKYPEHFWFVVGHMANVEDALVEIDVTLANAVRDVRTDYIMNPEQSPFDENVYSLLKEIHNINLDSLKFSESRTYVSFYDLAVGNMCEAEDEILAYRTDLAAMIVEQRIAFQSDATHKIPFLGLIDTVSEESDKGEADRTQADINEEKGQWKDDEADEDDIVVEESDDDIDIDEVSFDDDKMSYKELT